MKTTNIKILKSITENVSSLTIIQIANLLLPLVIYPHLITVLKISGIGVLALGQTTLTYVMVCVTYGFELTGAKTITTFRKTPKLLYRYYNDIILSMFIMYLVLLVLIIPIVELINVNKQQVIIIFLYLLAIPGYILSAKWFFQGLEKLKRFAIVTLLSKILYLILVLLLVKEVKDIYLVPVFFSISYLFVGLIFFFQIKKEYKRSYNINYLRIVSLYKEGWYIFLSRISASLYSSIGVYITAFYGDVRLVGIYDVAHKIYSAICSILSQISIALYPIQTKMYNSGKDAFRKFFLFSSYGTFVSSLISLIFIYNFSNSIVGIISDEAVFQSAYYLQLFSISFLFYPFGGLYTQNLVLLKQNKVLSQIVFTGFILSLISSISLTYLFGMEGLIISYSITYAFIFIAKLITSYRKI